MSKCLVLLVEGDTEVEFYKQIVANARKLHPQGRFDTNIEYRNVGGVGGFKSIALRKFIKEIKPKYDADCEYTVVLCSDTDVFDFAAKPPIKWDEVKKELRYNGASDIIHVQARRSIEDWFLYDLEGILGFLRLGKNTKVSGKNGYDKLRHLYKQANKKDIICETTGMKVILPTDENYFLNKNMSEITDGNYKILGKVVKICKESGEISLLRNTVFSRLQLDKMKEFQDVFNDPALSKFVGEGGITTTIQAPVVMIIPIAVYI